MEREIEYQPVERERETSLWERERRQPMERE
jgi:hypothetical protein